MVNSGGPAASRTGKFSAEDPMVPFLGKGKQLRAQLCQAADLGTLPLGIITVNNERIPE